jgi:hypothetical protein
MLHILQGGINIISSFLSHGDATKVRKSSKLQSHWCVRPQLAVAVSKCAMQVLFCIKVQSSSVD